MSNDLLDDLESLVDCDWKDVQEEFRQKALREELSEPVIPDFPVFEEFYAMMVDLIQEPLMSYRLQELVHRFVRNRDLKSNPAFDRVWSFFTDPRRYRNDEAICNDCGGMYVVIFEPERIPRVTLDRWSYEHTIEVRSETARCPNCGARMLHVTGKVVGVINNRRSDELKPESPTNF